jgi:hypothetical protein
MKLEILKVADIFRIYLWGGKSAKTWAESKIKANG